ncbi:MULTISPECIES: hypothetical protein [Pseudobacillus]|uniref:hypothetical protein n=1 Tax=Pseudobacillus TaxID=108525 RepID=UPI00387A5F18
MNIHFIEEPLLMCALVGKRVYMSPKEKEIWNFYKEHRYDFDIKGYQEGAEPRSLGRHLFTALTYDALECIKRTQEHGEMEEKRRLFQPIYDSFKEQFPEEYERALNELRFIVSETQQEIKKAGENTIPLWRQLSKNEKNQGVYAGMNPVTLDTNILSSFSYRDNINEKYSNQTHWSDLTLKRKISTEFILIHSKYVTLAPLGADESEVIIYNPTQIIRLSSNEGSILE